MNKILLFIITIFIPFTIMAQNWDERIVNDFNHHRINKNGVYTFSQSIYPLTVGAPTAGLINGFIQKDKKMFDASIETAAALGITYVSTQIMKFSFERNRPFVDMPNIHAPYWKESYSFPSGHTSITFSLATSLSLQYPKWYIIIPSYLYAVGIGYSRINLGLHYPSDVLIGAALGTASSFATHYIMKWAKNNNKYPTLQRFKSSTLSLAIAPEKFSLER